MKEGYLSQTFCSLLIFLLALAMPAAAQDDDHDHAHAYEGDTAYYLAGHGDFDIGFKDDQLELHIHLHAGAVVDGNSLAEDTTFDPDQLTVVVTETAEIRRPEGDLWEAAGVDVNEPMWVLPQHGQEDLPAFGLSTDAIPPGVLVDDLVTLTLRHIHGPGDFSLWESDAFGLPAFRLATHEQCLSVTLPVGQHSHYNWGFTTPGEYTLVFEVTGELAGGDYVAALAIYTFKVTEEPLCLAPVPGDVNGDGIVDEHDLEIIVENFGKTALVWPADDDASQDHHHDHD